MVKRVGMITHFFYPLALLFSTLRSHQRVEDGRKATQGLEFNSKALTNLSKNLDQKRKKISAPSSSSSRHRLFRGRSRASASSASSSSAPWGATFALVNCILGAGKGFRRIGNEGDGRERETVFLFFFKRTINLFSLVFLDDPDLSPLSPHHLEQASSASRSSSSRAGSSSGPCSSAPRRWRPGPACGCCCCSRRGRRGRG